MTDNEILAHAQRYRWIRDTQREDFRCGIMWNDDWSNPQASEGQLEVLMVSVGQGSTSACGEELDQAIDSELQNYPQESLKDLQDALRYLWLKHTQNREFRDDEETPGRLENLKFACDVEYHSIGFETPEGDELDARIDANMAKYPIKQG